MLPDWQLPPGTDRGVWDYTHNAELARNYDASLAGTPLLEADIRFAESHFPIPGRLIDLGCGTGRLALHFARRGFECVGVDLSPEMLAVLREKAGREGLSVGTVEANVVELDELPTGSFDYAACLFSTLGMVRGRLNRMRFLGHVRRLLKPGGVFVLHAHNRRFRALTRAGLAWAFGDWWRALRGKEPGDRTMPQHYGGAPLTLHHFTRREIRCDLREAGFAIRELEPVGVNEVRLKRPWCFGALRAYGYLIAAG